MKQTDHGEACVLGTFGHEGSGGNLSLTHAEERKETCLSFFLRGSCRAKESASRGAGVENKTGQTLRMHVRPEMYLSPVSMSIYVLISICKYPSGSMRQTGRDRLSEKPAVYTTVAMSRY